MRSVIYLLLASAVLVAGVIGCSTMAQMGGYEKVHGHPPPPPPPPAPPPRARIYPAEKVKEPGVFVQYERRSADGSGIIYINSDDCEPGPADGVIISYRCTKPKPVSKAKPAPKVEAEAPAE